MSPLAGRRSWGEKPAGVLLKVSRLCSFSSRNQSSLWNIVFSSLPSFLFDVLVENKNHCEFTLLRDMLIRYGGKL